MKIAISAGGTGGHISPGIALYKKAKEKGLDVIFISNRHALRFPSLLSIIPPQNLYILPSVQGLRRGFYLSNISTIYGFLKSIISSIKILRKEKPDVVIGTGGYASASVILASKFLGIPTAICEQNRIMGITNKFLSKISNYIFLSFPIEDIGNKHSKVYVVGNPIRFEGIDPISLKKEAYKYFGIPEEGKVLVVIGGSQGAVAINTFFSEIALELVNKIDNLWVIWSTGKEDFERVKTKVKGEKIKIFEFLDRVDLAFSIATLAISRAGSSTIFELLYFNVPAIYIPFPSAAENHQYWNAKFLEEKNAGILLEQKDLTPDILQKHIEKLLSDEKTLEEMRMSIRKIAIKDSAERIITEIIHAIRK